MKGIICKTLGGFFFTGNENQNIYRTKIRGKIREKVYPGDYVEFENDIIEKLYSRNSLLHRPAIANVDQVLIVLSVEAPCFDRKLLDRFLIMVEEAAMNPLIVINKIDLDNNSIEMEFEDYKKAGYQVFFLSVKEKIGFDSLIDSLHEHVNVLTGPSGVGKSSLINEIVKDANMEVAEVSKKLKRGVHTTRHVELLAVPEGGWLADSPGFTSLDIKHILADELRFFYPEFIDYMANCKFRACSHTHEPKCAVKDAVESGEISKRRYQSYLHFYKELK
ncbi:ribosome small subunit-dependent GTPase A [Natronospora cellulosivora (SeqCode)]